MPSEPRATAGAQSELYRDVIAWTIRHYFEDEAEDNARVLRLNARVDIAAGTFAGCLKTKEWSPLEHGSIEHKYYCPSAGGLMLVNELKGGTLRVEFIGNTFPRDTSRRRSLRRLNGTA
jgi:hypothetical protein